MAKPNVGDLIPLVTEKEFNEHKADYVQYKNDTNTQLENTKGTVSASGTTGEVTNVYQSQVNASQNSTANKSRSQVNASRNSTANAYDTQINASYGSTINGGHGQINASYGSTINSGPGQINASYGSTINSDPGQINASDNSTVDGRYSQINASQNCYTTNQPYGICGGSIIMASGSVKNENTGVVVGGAGTGDPSTQNRKWEISSQYGTIKASGSITGNSSFADFAEYFESIDGESIPLGTIVSLAQSGKIKIAQEGEYMVGVLSQTAGVILNAQGFEWKDRYQYDRYGQPIYVDREVEVIVDTDEEGNDIKETQIIEAPMLNPDWDETKEYIPREDRPEWNVVGLAGQIYTNIDETVQEGDFVKVGKNGIATKGRNEYGQNWQVMKITTPYEEKLGFGIAVVFVR